MSFHPIVLAACLGGVVAAVAVISACMTKSGTTRTVLLVLAFVFLIPAGYVFLAFNPWLADARFRTYRAFYRDIEIGMTRQQVLTVMEQRYPTNGSRKPPKVMQDWDNSLGFFMNPESSREPNCEGIFLTLTNGRVVKKDYSPD